MIESTQLAQLFKSHDEIKEMVEKPHLWINGRKDLTELYLHGFEAAVGIIMKNGDYENE